MNTAKSPLDGAKFGSKKIYADPRGSLSVLDFAADLPFVPVRMFWIFDVPPGGQRGAHAHKLCRQYLVCTRGSVEIEAFDGVRTAQFTLNAGDYLDCLPRTYLTLTFKADHSVVNVFCDRPYEADDYIYDKAELLAADAPGGGSR
jgi:hypothetical protein